MQLGVGADGGLWEAMDRMLGRMQGKVRVRWVGGHEEEEEQAPLMTREGTPRLMMPIAQQPRGWGAGLG